MNPPETQPVDVPQPEPLLPPHRSISKRSFSVILVLILFLIGVVYVYSYQKNMRYIPPLDLSQGIEYESAPESEINSLVDLPEDSITTLKDFTYPRETQKLVLNLVEDAENVVFPEQVVGDVLLNSLVDAKNITFPKRVYGDVHLEKLSVVENVVLPEYVSGNLYIGALSNTQYGDYATVCGGYGVFIPHSPARISRRHQAT